MKLKAFIIPVMVLTLSACEALKMPKTTSEMNKTTKNMSETTQGMSATTEKMAGNMEQTLVKMDQTNTTMQEMHQGTADLLCQNRSKEAQESRDRNFNRLKEVESFEEKLVHAAVFFKSFEFQLWRNAELECRPRSEFIHHAAKEFFRKSAGLFSNIELKDLTPAEAKENNDVLTLMALSVAMHEIHPFQEDVLSKDETVEKVSVLSIIKDALQKSEALENATITTDALTHAESEVIFWQVEATLFLNMRQNFLATMMLAKVSDIATAEQLEKVKMVMGSWDSKYHKINTVRQEKVLKFVGESLKTRDFLKANNFKHDFDENLKKILTNMKISSCTPETCNAVKAKNSYIFAKLVEGITKEKPFNSIMQEVALELAQMASRKAESEREPDDTDD